jgi:pyruvate,orthophosphate dikinase
VEVYRFSGTIADYKGDPKSKEAKALLGGKGAGLTMMAQQGLNVPPGFTIPTTVCNEWRKLTDEAQKTAFMDSLMGEVVDHMIWLEGLFGYRPLVSVRSGAPISMPGMMDTILNVGLTSDVFDEWEGRIGNRASIDSFRRLIQMLGSTGYGVPLEVFDFQLASVKKLYGVKFDTDLTSDMLDNCLQRYRKAFKQNKGFDFPDDDANDADEQLRVAIRAVFDSWMNPRAIEYRKINKIDEAMGTAVNVQAMVFGNMGENSGTGVLFSRNPSTGEPGMMGEYLTNAQGEDVVAGIRTPMDVSTMPVGEKAWPYTWADVHVQLTKLCAHLEAAYKDMVDIEFTVQKGELFVLQSRSGKRSARAAFKIAVDMVAEGMIDKPTALRRLTTDQFKAVRRPTIDPKFKIKPHYVGLPACPGVVTGRPVFSSEDAVKATDPVILVTHETDPDDIAGMAKAVGILTKTGGATSHAAVVARAMDKTCVVGCTDLDLSMADSGLIGVPGEGKQSNANVTIDGSTGGVWIGIDVPVIDASDDPAVKTVMGWCMAILGAHETAPVDLGVDRPHRVLAAIWWGSKDALDAVLAGIEDLPYRTHVALDLATPESHAQPCDLSLTNCFGAIPLDTFQQDMVTALINRAQKLAGLTLVNVPDKFQPALVQAGYKVGGSDTHTVPVAVPPDYAAFTVLAA